MFWKLLVSMQEYMYAKPFLSQQIFDIANLWLD